MTLEARSFNVSVKKMFEILIRIDNYRPPSKKTEEPKNLEKQEKRKKC